MCGIFGHLHVNTESNSEHSLAQSRQCLHTLTHRGPDQWDEFSDNSIYMGHRRLSILDTSDAGKQPMVFKKQNGKKIVLTINGEVWNYKDLHKDLKQKYGFKSTSDSECVLYGYDQWGINALLEKLDGMYAFTIYDEDTKQVHVVRDRYGIKPIYFTSNYTRKTNTFAYASEIKALLKYDSDLRQFSRQGTMEWCLHRGSHSGTTIYAGVNKLPPGHAGTFDIQSNTFKIRQYYDVIDEIDEGLESNPNDLPEVFNNAIQKRLMADVPIGLQLSGGIDSSLVAYAMRNHIKDNDLHSFSIGFSDKDEQKYSEEPYARQVAQQLNLTHHQINISRTDIAHAYEHVLWLCDGMMDFPNTIPIYLLSQFSKDYVTVQLTGEGADELFGGYGKFAFANILNQNNVKYPQALSSWIGKNIRSSLGRSMALKSKYKSKKDSIINNLNSYISSETLEFKSDLTQKLWPHSAERRRKFERLSFDKQLLIVDHKTYLHVVLERQDRGSMGASIESRVPFLDRNLIKFALNLPTVKLFTQQQSKIILKDYAASIFGHDFAHRKKMGFPLPLQDWMHDKQGLQPFLEQSKRKDFAFYEDFERMKKNDKFDHMLLNYPDSEKQWVNWFGMTLANTQQKFRVTNIVEDGEI